MSQLVILIVGAASGGLGFLVLLIGTADAGQAPAVPPVVINGPPPPQLPEVISRDVDGRATVRAVRLDESLRVDGALDERVYQDVQALSDFIQSEPEEGAPATEKTEAWVLFDDDHIYISVRCWASRPVAANDMRRDSHGVFSGEFVNFIFDTFYDGRNSVDFTVNPIGGRMDGQVVDERDFFVDWNPVWQAETGRFDGGWTFEAAIPFKSLRYRPGRTQVWGINFLRQVKNAEQNESSYLVPIPAGLSILQTSLAATLVGLEAPEAGPVVDIKPYAIADLTSDRTAIPALSNELGGDLGIDVKYGITQNLVADLTVNTDFAQVEPDEEQVNLTRFSLFFPEKREFFLENQGLFAFGGTNARAFGSSATFGGIDNTPVLFYSRRIGLQDGQEVPIIAGGRLTGRVGTFSVGLLNVQTDSEAVSEVQATNFSVVRVKRDVLRRSSIGAIFAGRSVSTLGPGSNQAYGLDGTFAFYDNLSINTYWARTQTADLGEDEDSYRAQLDYDGDRYGVRAERLVVGTDFNPEVGFLRRDDFERSFGALRFSPRLHSVDSIRQLFWEGHVDYITNRAGMLETRVAQGRFTVGFENSDEVDVTYTRAYEFLDEPFLIGPDVAIPVGGYRFHDARVSFTGGTQRQLSGSVAVQHGSFYSGTKTGVEVISARLGVTSQLSVEPGVSFNWVNLVEGDFTTELVTARTTYTMTPLMFVSALLQYNSSTNALGANVRFRWEYQPGSELFVMLKRPRFSWTRIKGESNVQGGGGNGSVEGRGTGRGIGADGGSPEGDWSPCRRGGGRGGRPGAGAAVERQPEARRGAAATAWRIAGGAVP